jgi:hypothetical protein
MTNVYYIFVRVHSVTPLVRSLRSLRVLPIGLAHFISMLLDIDVQKHRWKVL